LFGVGDIDSAYAVQATSVSREVSRGGRVVGAKIGLTSLAVQRAFDVYEPDFGTLFADMCLASGEEIAADRLIQPRVEAEVAFVLGRDLALEQVTTADVLRATAFVLPAIEVVDSRVAGWDIAIVDTIADNASSGLFVLGNRPCRIDEVDLRLCGMMLSSGGETCAVGAGAATMGDPVNAVTWLAKTMVRTGRPLAAGDVVLSGALGPMVAVTPGAVYEARISRLGTVRAAFPREG
jgi:2-keto-4-pentenoate hydratase